MADETTLSGHVAVRLPEDLAAAAAGRERIAAEVKARADELAREAVAALNARQPGARQMAARADGWAQAAAFIAEGQERARGTTMTTEMTQMTAEQEHDEARAKINALCRNPAMVAVRGTSPGHGVTDAELVKASDILAIIGGEEGTTP